MTEQEWLVCNDPEAMLALLKKREKGSDRKFWLFVVAAWRHSERALDLRDVMSSLERRADLGHSPSTVRHDERDASLRGSSTFADLLLSTSAVIAAELCCVYNPGTDWKLMKLDGRGFPLERTSEEEDAAYETAIVTDKGKSAALLRELFGCLPFRSLTTAQGWIAWNGGTIPALATAIYDEQTFDRMPILADALEDAGCDNRDILDHCRGPGPHVRGCWVLDLLLGKE